MIEISEKGWENGHSKHEGDHLIMDANGDGYYGLNECMYIGDFDIFDCNDDNMDVWLEGEITGYELLMCTDMNNWSEVVDNSICRDPGIDYYFDVNLTTTENSTKNRLPNRQPVVTFLK